MSSTPSINRKYLKDNLSNKFYPIITRDCLVGGIGRGSNRTVVDLSGYLKNGYSGEFTLKIMGDHIHYYSINITKDSGVFNSGENIISDAIPVIYYPSTDLVFTGSISPDTTSKISLYISSVDGKIRLYVNDRKIISNNPLTITSNITANTVTGIAATIQ